MSGVHNENSGFVGGNLFQFRDGNITFNQIQRMAPTVTPNLVMAPPPHYTNNERPLLELDEFFSSYDGAGLRVAMLVGIAGSGCTTLGEKWIDAHRADFPDGCFEVTYRGEGEQLKEILRSLLSLVVPDIGQLPDSVEGLAYWWRTWSTGKKIALLIDDAVTEADIRALLPGPGPSAVLVTTVAPVSSGAIPAKVRPVSLSPMDDPVAIVLLEKIIGVDRARSEPQAIGTLLGICGGSTIALCVAASIVADSPDDSIAGFARKLEKDERTLKLLSPKGNFSVTVVLDAAYERLDDEQRRCYRLLGVHPGSHAVGVEAMSVALGIDVDDVELGRGKLIGKVPNEDRYFLLGLPKKHAQAKVDDVERELFATRLLSYYAEYALSAGYLAMSKRGWLERIWPERVVVEEVDRARTLRALSSLDDERANLLAIAELAVERGKFDEVCQIAMSLWPLHQGYGYFRDMVAVNEIGVRSALELENYAMAAILGFQLGFGYLKQGIALDRAAAAFQRAAEHASRSGMAEIEATAVESLGLLYVDQGDRDAAARLLRTNLEVAQEIGEPRRIALAKLHLAKVVDVAESLTLLEQALAFFVENADDEGQNIVKVLIWKAKRLAVHDASQAFAVVMDAAKRADDSKWHVEKGQIYEVFADISLTQGAPEQTKAYLESAVAIYQANGLTSQHLAARDRLAEL